MTGEVIIDTRCGLSCAACDYRESTGCGGCIATSGHPFHGECVVAVCCRDKGFLHCGLCPDIPCRLLLDYTNDPVHGDDPPGARIEQCKNGRSQADNDPTIFHRWEDEGGERWMMP